MLSIVELVISATLKKADRGLSGKTLYGWSVSLSITGITSSAGGKDTSVEDSPTGAGAAVTAA